MSVINRIIESITSFFDIFEFLFVDFIGFIGSCFVSFPPFILVNLTFLFALIVGLLVYKIFK